MRSLRAGTAFAATTTAASTSAAVPTHHASKSQAAVRSPPKSARGTSAPGYAATRAPAMRLL